MLTNLLFFKTTNSEIPINDTIIVIFSNII